MNAKDYITVIIIAVLLWLVLFGFKHRLDSQILPQNQNLSFYLSSSFEIVESQLLFRYSFDDNNYAQKVEELDQMCKKYRNSTKLILVNMEDNHIAGAYNIDLCWDGHQPLSELTPFIFSLNTTQRLLFMKHGAGTGHPSAFLFGRTVGIKAKPDGLYGCFSKKFFEAGRFIDWTNKKPGDCFKINQLEVFSVVVEETWNIKDRIEDLTANNYHDELDGQNYEDL